MINIKDEKELKDFQAKVRLKNKVIIRDEIFKMKKAQLEKFEKQPQEKKPD